MWRIGASGGGARVRRLAQSRCGRGGTAVVASSNVRLGIGVLVFCLALMHASPSQAANHPSAGGPQQPNIVLIQTDDQALSQFNSAVMPNVTKLLASGGTRFDHAY